MAMKLIVIASSLMVAVALGQQRNVPSSFGRPSAGSRVVNPLQLEPEQPMPQPFRRVSLPLYRGRGFSLDGHDPKPTVQQTFQAAPIEASGFNRAAAANGEEADEPQLILPLRQAPQQQLQPEVIQQQQTDRVQQQQQTDRVQQQQQQPEKQFSGFRLQPQVQPAVETQQQFVRKVVQRPLKRVQVTKEEMAASRSPEMIQKLKIERTESADKQRAKKPVSQVLRRYRDDNPDGSITWGFENDDGTFKEETIGVDCVTRGKYGYVDPEGVKREYTYESGVRCDKNRIPYGPTESQQQQSSAVQEAQASDTYGYIDYTKNQYVMANGQTISLNGMARNRARKPVPRKNSTPAPAQ